MAQHHEATARQLDFTYDGWQQPPARPVTRPRRGPARLCVVCGRVRAHLTVERQPGQRPARLCLRCHHAVLQQRRMVRAQLDERSPCAAAQPSAPAPALIVPVSERTDAAKYRQLSTSRRRAQKAARRALESAD